MTKVVTDDQIFDIRNYSNDIEFDRHQARRLAQKDGYDYLAWNGVIRVTATDEEIFFPPAGFFTPESLPFIGWKKGYSYSGTSQWLLCNKKVGFAVIPFRKK